MHFEKGMMYHVYNQGNNRRQVFFEDRHYLYFLTKMRRYLLPYVDFLSWCLMPNHFHWQVCPHTLEVPLRILSSKIYSNRLVPLNEAIGILLRTYTRMLNKEKNWTGSVFRKETKAKDGFVEGFITVDTKGWDTFDYDIQCFHYIHQNAPKAGLVKRPEDWKYCSAPDYAGLRNGSLVNKKLARHWGLIT